MITLHDYLPSQNAYKVRLLLSHLQRPYATKLVSIFEGAGQNPDFLTGNPAGAVPVLELEDGCLLPESNAILFYLAAGTRYLPAASWDQAQVVRWLCFEEDYIQNGLASLRHWTLTGKIANRSEELIAQKKNVSLKTLRILDRWLQGRTFLGDAGYSIADISVFAYVSRADEAGIPLTDFAAVDAWVERVKAEPRHLATVHPYSLDPFSTCELV